MIEVKNISKSFGGTHVLKDVSATFEKGKVNFIIGRSGSGKSVLTKCTVGLLEPDLGHVFFDGRDFTVMNRKERKEIRKEIGMLFQGGALFDSMTVSENIKFPLKMFSDMDEASMSARVQDCLSRVELEGQGDKFPAELSGGMQKRVGIARAISMNPKYLFCDEPNSGLDPKTAITIDELISSITKDNEITTIINTHDMNSVMENGENICFLDQGEIAWQGHKDEVLENENPKLQEFIFASPFLKKLRSRALNAG